VCSYLHMSSYAYPELRLGYEGIWLRLGQLGMLEAGATVVVDWQVSATVEVGSS
jgi:hypothetical protein